LNVGRFHEVMPMLSEECLSLPVEL